MERVEAWGTGRFDNTNDVTLQVVPIMRKMQGRLAFMFQYLHPGYADYAFYVPTVYAYGPEIYYEFHVKSSRKNLMQILLGKLDATTLQYKGHVAEVFCFGGIDFKFPAGFFLSNDPLELLFFEVMDYSGDDCILEITGTGIKATHKVPYQYVGGL